MKITYEQLQDKSRILQSLTGLNLSYRSVSTNPKCPAAQWLPLDS